MEEIRRIVKELQINEKRLMVELGRKEALKIRRRMSDLSFNQTVAEYAYTLDQFNYESKRLEARGGNDISTLTTLTEYNHQLEELESYMGVKEYIALQERLDAIDRDIEDYYQTIQTDLRYFLSSLKMPPIFVYQGLDKSRKYKVAKHIIIPGSVQMFSSTPDTVIYPADKNGEKSTNFFSERKHRHFYNDVSFRYLSQLTQDESFDIKTKKLGRIVVE